MRYFYISEEDLYIYTVMTYLEIKVLLHILFIFLKFKITFTWQVVYKLLTSKTRIYI